MNTEQYSVGFYGLMEHMDTREILAANLALLRQKYPQFSSAPALERATARLEENKQGKRVGRTTVQRMLDGTTPVNIDYIESVARVFGLDAWQLLVPGMSPKHPPVLRSVGPAEDEIYRKLEAAKQALDAALGTEKG